MATEAASVDLKKSLTGKQRASYIVGGILVLAIVAWIVWRLVYNMTTYKAVFLTNGQVYFGKSYAGLMNPVVLHDIYYLQQQSTQPQDGQQADNGQIQLIKLGNEIHGPKDVMRINAEQVLFVEDLKEDSQVVKLIKQFQKNGGATPSAAPSTSSSPSPSESK
jgi:hypothetical protein